MGGIQDNFGGEFKYVKVNVDVKDMDQATITLTEKDGIVIELTNQYVFENPSVTLDNEEGSDDEDGDAVMPFMEIEVKHRLSVSLSHEANEIIDFNVGSLSTEMTNLALYFQSENDFEADDEAKAEMLEFLTNKYVQDVNSVNTHVEMDKEQSEDRKGKTRVNLPINQMLLKSIDNITISCFDGFLLIEADPKKITQHQSLMNLQHHKETTRAKAPE